MLAQAELSSPSYRGGDFVFYKTGSLPPVELSVTNASTLITSQNLRKCLLRARGAWSFNQGLWERPINEPLESPLSRLSFY